MYDNKTKQENNEVLFKLVWNNLYIRNIIFYYLRLFNLFTEGREFFEFDQLNEFKYKNYLKEVTIYFRKYYKHFETIETLIPPNIESLYTSIRDQSDCLPKQLPKTIKLFSISFISQDLWEKFLNISNLNEGPSFYTLIKSSNLETLCIDLYGIVDNGRVEFDSGMFPNTLRNLSIKNHLYGVCDISITKNSIPNTLKSFSINETNEFEKDLFSNMPDLKSINVYHMSNGLFKKNQSILLKLESLKLINRFKNDNITMSPKDLYNIHQSESLTNLEIKITNFPSSFSPNLTSLIIETVQHDKVDLNAIPTKQLKNLEINCKKFTTNSKSNLRLPNTLQFLKLLSPFNQKLKINFLPNFLISLDLGNSFNHKIPVNFLPPTLKYLILGIKFDKEIIEGSIPHGLESLTIHNSKYQKPIKLSNPLTVVNNFNYYKQFELNPQDLKSFIIPQGKTTTIINQYLNKFINLEYLDIGYCEDSYLIKDIFKNKKFDKLKTLVLQYNYQSTINLEQFPNLEILKIKFSCPIIQTTNSNGQLISLTEPHEENDQLKLYSNDDEPLNFYKLKEIQVFTTNTPFIDSLNEILIPFIKLMVPKYQ